MSEPLSADQRTQLRLEREALKAKYSEFFAKVSALMFVHDPIGINFADNSDEYDPEAGTVIPRIQFCTNVGDLTRVLHQEFVRWFGAETAGPEGHYQTLSRAIWTLATTSGWPTAESAA